jgi:integrase
MVTPHAMRHTTITFKREIATIQRISGHKTAAMVMRYTHRPSQPPCARRQSSTSRSAIVYHEKRICVKRAPSDANPHLLRMCQKSFYQSENTL